MTCRDYWCPHYGNGRCYATLWQKVEQRRSPHFRNCGITDGDRNVASANDQQEERRRFMMGDPFIMEHS